MYLEMLRKLNIDFTMNKNKLYNIFFTFIHYKKLYDHLSLVKIYEKTRA